MHHENFNLYKIVFIIIIIIQLYNIFSLTVNNIRFYYTILISMIAI